MSIPLWTVPLALCVLLTILGGVGQWWRSRKHTRRIRRAWDVPDGVTAQDVKALAEARGWVMIYDTY